MFLYRGKSVVKTINPIEMPKVIITKKAFLKMSSIVNHSKMEVSWLGIVEELEDSTFCIEDVYLFDQVVTAVTTEISARAIMEFAEKIIMADPINGPNNTNKIRMWGHSHVNMTVAASSVDNNQMRTFQNNGCKHFIRLICNKLGDMQIDFYDYENNFIYENIYWTTTIDNVYETEIMSELNKKVTVAPVLYGNYYGGKGQFLPKKNNAVPQNLKKEREK